MRCPEFLFSLIIVTAGYIHADSVIDLCPRRTSNRNYPVVSSAIIKSPGYPDKFNGQYSCILIIRVPEYTLVTLVVDGPFRLFEAYKEQAYFELSTPQQTKKICGSEDNNTEIYRACTGDSPFNISAHFRTTIAWSKTGNYMFNIKYTAFNVLSNNSSRSVKSQRELYFVSHGGYNGVADYPNNIHTAIAITDLGLHSSVSLEFSDGLDLADGEDCSDYLDIVGVRGYPNNTKRLCGNLSPEESVYLTSAANDIVLGFKTNSFNTTTGFQLKYTVISKGCSDAELFPNATLTPTPGSNSTFTLTCPLGFAASKSTQTQIVKCVGEQWLPSLLPCQEMLDVNKATRKAMGSAIGGSVAAVLLIILVVITVICLRRRQQCRTLCRCGISCNTQQKSGSSDSKVVRDDANSNGDNESTERMLGEGKRTAATTPYTLADPTYAAPETYHLAGPIEMEDESAGPYSVVKLPATTYGNQESTTRDQRATEVADVYTEVNIKSKKKTPLLTSSAAVEDDDVMVENDLYVPSNVGRV